MTTQQTISERFDGKNAMVDHITAATDYARMALEQLSHSFPLAHDCLQEEIIEARYIAENRSYALAERIRAADELTAIVSDMMAHPQCDEILILDD